MSHDTFSEPLRSVSALERANNSTATPRIRASDELVGENTHIFDLESETSQRIPSERIEA